MTPQGRGSVRCRTRFCSLLQPRLPTPPGRSHDPSRRIAHLPGRHRPATRLIGGTQHALSVCEIWVHYRTGSCPCSWNGRPGLLLLQQASRGAAGRRTDLVAALARVLVAEGGSRRTSFFRDGSTCRSYGDPGRERAAGSPLTRRHWSAPKAVSRQAVSCCTRCLSDKIPRRRKSCAQRY